ncbi:malate dehydrogenase [Nitzschia inconspicua]|uniref:Malate dehydrogenase n=1 Tax=Nitzschia inconspicua TaxID=303405 RepID=A0A9K3LQ88_9STRA|nr:malate dehydrogenase [Nitzschia inconspicua]
MSQFLQSVAKHSSFGSIKVRASVRNPNYSSVLLSARARPFTNDTSIVSKPMDSSGRSSHNILFDTHFNNLRLAHTRAPIPYTSALDEASAPLNYDPAHHGHLGHKKVTIVGCGQVGMATAYALLNQASAGTIALIDAKRERLEGEAKDLEQGSAFHQHIRILASDEYSVSKDSHLVIVTAGAAQKPGESRLNLVERNVSIMQSIIPKVLSFSPNAAICVVANPCDILTAVASKIAGPTLPAGRIFGSGTCLDSSRLQSLISKILNLDTSAVQGYILGEHGDSSVPVWSSVRIGGLPFLKPGEEPGEIHERIHQEVVNSAYDVIERKGSTNWAIGLTNAFIAKAILYDTRNIMPLSTCVRGMYGIKEDVFLSVPCAVGAFGIHRAVQTWMSPSEQRKFVETAGTIWEIQKEIWNNV